MVMRRQGARQLDGLWSAFLKTLLRRRAVTARVRPESRTSVTSRRPGWTGAYHPGLYAVNAWSADRVLHTYRALGERAQLRRRSPCVTGLLP